MSILKGRLHGDSYMYCARWLLVRPTISTEIMILVAGKSYTTVIDSVDNIVEIGSIFHYHATVSVKTPSPDSSLT